jgi:arsenate reductase (glutaredoxin)
MFLIFSPRRDASAGLDKPEAPWQNRVERHLGRVSADEAHMLLYHYPACQTCKKAIAFLNQASIPHTPIHIVESPPSRDQLERWWRTSGVDLKRLFNTSGQSWKTLDLTARWGGLDDDSKLDILAADGKLIKRPILVVDEDHAHFGFKQLEWSEYAEYDGSAD